MWPRITELAIGIWLCVSPLLFRASDSTAALASNSFICGTLVMATSFLSFWEPTRHARIGTALVGLWLLGFSYATAGRPAALELQNLFVSGLLLILFAVVPNEANRPPRPWRKFVSSAAGGAPPPQH